jgi:thioredoxin-related protein
MRPVFTLAFLLLSSMLVRAQSGPIAFVNGSWADAQAMAKKEHKNIFLYAASPGCHWCKPMEKGVFTDSAVSQYYTATFVSYKINVDEGEGKVLATRYAVRAMPTYLYFNSEGKLLHMSSGYKPAVAFIQDGNDAFDPSKAFFTLKERYEAGDRNADFLYTFGTAPALSQQQELYDQVNSDYFKTQNPESLASKKNQEYLFNAGGSFDAPVTQYFLAHRLAFITRFGQSEVNSKTRSIISNATRKLGSNNDLPGLDRLQQAISRIMPAEVAQWNDLARIQYLLNQNKRDWPAYTEAVLAYGKKYAGKDSFTSREATVYLTAFVADKALLTKGDQIIRRVLAVDRSYDNLCTRAKLLHKLENDQEATVMANEAVAVAAKNKQDNEEATELLTEISHKKQG